MLPIAPLIASALIGSLAAAASSLVGRVLIALGVSYLTFTGVDALLSNLTAAINSRMDGVPSDLAAWLGILKVQTSISILIAAFTTRLAMVAIGGTFKKAVLR
jgi:hypothetical protein